MLDFHILRSDSEADIAALFALFEQAAEYSLLVEGRAPTPEDARNELVELPPGKSAVDKFFGGYWQRGLLVGCADLIRGYPDPETAYLGLLLFAPAHRGRGLGVAALEHLAGLARSWGCTALRLAVIDKNLRGLNFWRRQGFDECYRKSAPGFVGDAIVMQKSL